MNIDSEKVEPKQCATPSVINFCPNNLSHIFKNINHKPCKSPCYDYAWDVLNNGIFVGELFYSNDFREWNFIKDNFPAPRRAYKTSFPMNTNFFIQMFKSINVNLELDYQLTDNA